MKKKADKSLIELLTKRYNKKKIYSEQAKKDFQKLVSLSKLPIHPTTNKYNLVESIENENNNNESMIKIISDPNELVNRLEILTGEISAGNDSNMVKNELSEVLDKLLEHKILTPLEHQMLFKKFIMKY